MRLFGSLEENDFTELVKDEDIAVDGEVFQKSEVGQTNSVEEVKTMLYTGSKEVD